ncbi:MAG: transketolase [Anaerolineae bacterium]|nr:transketolase [Anaerolineae bacterium]
MEPGQLHELKRRAAELRLHVVRMMGAGKAHHFGGSLSSADIVTALYFYKMRYDPQNPAWPDRDRFIMSKGHCVPAQYAALAMLGVIPLEELPTLKELGSRLQGHPAAHLVPGIEGCTGSLGQGLSFANGMALAARIQKRNYQVYCLLGDGETQEGQVWEAAMTASKQCLGNLTAIIDGNGLKAMDEPSCAKLMEPMAQKWAAFGWYVREIDGHDMDQICQALDWAEENADAPSMIIAHTVKGKGISFIEGRPEFHNAPLTEEQLQKAIAELEANLRELEEDGR